MPRANVWCSVQAELAQQRAATAAAEERAVAAAEDAATLRSQPEAPSRAMSEAASVAEGPTGAKDANGHAENGSSAAEEQVMV